MRLKLAREPIKDSVRKWIIAERKEQRNVPKNPTILVQFFWKPRFTANLFLYHKRKGKEPKTKEVLTTNSEGELLTALETIYDEWGKRT